MNLVKIILLLLFLSITLNAQDTSQTFLSLRNTGVESFQKTHPEYDGRGTIVLVLDTGVDMGVEGLLETSTGEVKVIDVQDFTGQGDTPFYEADVDEEDGQYSFNNDDHNLKITSKKQLTYKSINDEYYIGVVKETLWKNSGSRAGDLNGNGNKDDNFHFITFKVNNEGEEFWVVYFDTNADGDLSNEKPLRNYKEKYDSFVIPNETSLSKFTLGLNIFPDENLVSFYFDDGSHGTHCAGISAGNRIGDSDLFGVAPGAYVIGLKLGNNNFSGGATVAESMKKSYLYADKISKERKEPCIINMSFGIGSEIEGHADIEIFLKELVKENPYLYIATSNGNEGPGLSTSGMPSASDDIFSSGAVLSEEVGNDLYGTTLNRDIILHFSSRGGEVSKPDVVAPGACVSTVPNFSRGDRFWGTSMASPYSAGVMAILLGAAKIEYPDVKIPSKVLYSILRESASPMEGYTHVDQGGGLINVENAYTLLKKYIENGEINNFETYSITSLAPNMPNASAPNLYIRDASYLNGSEKFSYRIKRDNFINTNKFYRLYNLKSDSDWLNVVQKKIHIRNNQAVYVNAKIDSKILDQPGLYNAKISATRADKSKTHEFDMMASVIVPYEFNTANDYTLSFEDVKIEPGMHKRYFLKIPIGTSNLDIQVSSDKKNFTSVRYYLHDADGRNKLYGSLNALAEAGIKNSNFQDLEPGVYEFIILGQYTSEKESICDINFEIDGINILGHSINDNGEVKVVNYFSKAKTYNLDGELLGYRKSSLIKMNGEEVYEIPFKLNLDESKKTFKFSLSKEVFNKVTDFAIMIYDKDGKSKSISGLSYKEGSISIKKVEKDKIEDYKLVIVPGFANKPSEIDFKITEETYLASPESFTVKVNNKSTFTMYPSVTYKLDCDYDLNKYKIIEGAKYFGSISFTSKKTQKIEVTKLINITR